MNYEDYVENQTVTHGQVIKPVQYHLGERKAIDWFVVDARQTWTVLDVGCAVGLGMRYFQLLGCSPVVGIDLSPDKVQVARWFGLTAFAGDIARKAVFPPVGGYDLIWCSHTFEHMLEPDKALEVMKAVLSPRGRMGFVLPYPDTGDPTAHCASARLGLRKKDDGKSVLRWFSDRGMYVVKTDFSSVREDEIWIALEKDDV